MATLEERLAAAGVEDLEALEAKIKADATTAAEAGNKEAKEGLEKQVTDLEKIKGTQGTEIGDLRKRAEAAEEEAKILKESKQTENDDPANRRPEKSGDDWKRENADREKAFKDEDWDKVDAALKDADPDVRELAKTEEGRAAFYNQILGSSSTETQETFRRPQKKEKLSVAEQIDQALNKDNGNRVPSLRPSGIGTSKQTNEQNNQSGQTVVNASMSERRAALQPA